MTAAQNPLPLPGPGPERAARREIARLLEIAARFYRSLLPGSWVPGYLADRGFAPAVQEHWQAGYAPAAWNALTHHLRAGSYPDSLIEAAGLARRTRRGDLIDTFRDRAMLPIRSGDGTIVAFIGRAAEHADPRVPKYLNSPGTDLYNKSEVLFGLWQARGQLARGARPVIVEGPFDAIAVTAACASRNVGVSPCGAVLTGQQATVLEAAADLRAAGVLVAFDPDQAGRLATISAYQLLSPLTSNTTAAILPPGQDPAQILHDHGPAGLAGMLSRRTRPLADLVIDAEVDRWSQWLRHPEGQIKALRAAAPVIAAMPPAHVAHQVARLAAKLGLDHAIVTEAVTDALTEIITAGRRIGSIPKASPPQTDRRTQPSGGLPEAPLTQSSTAARAAALDFPNNAQRAIGHAASPESADGQGHPAPSPEARLRAGRVPG
jgi:DNA primase catalytic core